MADPADRRPDPIGPQRHDRTSVLCGRWRSRRTDTSGWRCRLDLAVNYAIRSPEVARRLAGGRARTRSPHTDGPAGSRCAGHWLASLPRALVGSRGRLKPTLMDQSVIAGLGNLLTDEICWRAKIPSVAPVHRSGRRRLKRLHAAMTAGFAHRGAPRPGSRSAALAHRSPRRTPDPNCPRCGTALSHDRINGTNVVVVPQLSAQVKVQQARPIIAGLISPAMSSIHAQLASDNRCDADSGWLSADSGNRTGRTCTTSPTSPGSTV